MIINSLYRRFFIWMLVFAGIFLFLACSEDIPEGEGDPGKNQEEEEETIPFDKVPGLDEMVVYEVNNLAFGPNGTFSNVIDRLDSIKNLGVNVLWLMPIYPEGIENGVDSPYCIRDYYDVNPDYGTLDDFKLLVKEAHNREMAVILDWVANHTSWDNEWIVNTDWYTQDAYGNIVSPAGTNWADVADLNFDNAEMKDEMIKAMKFWITTTNIDGFRCDAVEFVPHDFWKQAIDELKTIPDRNLILLAESATTQSFTSGFQMNYGWDFQSKLANVFSNGASAGTIISANNAENNSLHEGTKKLRFITNHDICAWEASPADQFVSSTGSVTAFVITAFMGGVPMIYTGQEIGYSEMISFFDLNPIDWNSGQEIYNTYKRIMKTRGENIHILSGDIKSYPHKDVLAYKRIAGDDELLIIANVRKQNSAFALPADLQNTSWVNTLNQQQIVLENELTLNAFQFLILKNE